MRWRCGVLAALGLVAALGLAARKPVAFQKITALTEAPLPPFESRAAVDIASVVRAIPDRGAAGTADTVYEVLPARRYQRSVVDGLGNCSNLVKGLSWALIRDGYDFEIVHLMPIETFLEGQGHTVLRAKLALPEGERIGLADVAAAAIPRAGERALDIADLLGHVPDLHLDPLRPESEDWTWYYTPEFRSDVAIGRISASDTAWWYGFLDAIYLDVGLPKKLDKIVYVGVGVTLGVYPAIHVESVEALRSRHPYEFARMNAALWVIRVTPLILLGCVLWWLAERSHRRYQLAVTRPARRASTASSSAGRISRTRSGSK